MKMTRESDTGQVIYCYDGSYAGLLTLLSTTVATGPAALRIAPSAAVVVGLFDAPSLIATNAEQAARFQQEIEGRLGRRTLRHLRLAYLSERPGIEGHVHGYLQLGWRVGPALNNHLAHADVHAVLTASRRTARESHRLRGLVRFQELSDSSYYAQLRPDANVLPLLARHFAERMDRPWLLHDVGRDLGVMGDQQRYWLGKLERPADVQLAATEQDWQRLWRCFHRSIAIASRHNPSLQRQDGVRSTSQMKTRGTALLLHACIY
ncbi:MAG: TIGR03915 family putative DNA repair protein [Desulfuromonadales bacterium]